MKQFEKFILCESGAISVDWVVLTSAIVGIGIAVISVVSSGVDGTSGSIVNNIYHSLTADLENSAHGYITAAVANNPNRPRAAFREARNSIRADAPAGYAFTGRVDNASGQPIYRSNSTPRMYSIGGNVSTPRAYRSGGGTSTRLRDMV